MPSCFGQAASYTIDTIAGSDWVGDGGPATSAILIQSEGSGTDGSGNLVHRRCGRSSRPEGAANGVIETLAGTGIVGFSGDGGPAAQAQLNSPYGLALDGQGNLYIADLGNARVRRSAWTERSRPWPAEGRFRPAAPTREVRRRCWRFPRRAIWRSTSGNLYISDFGGQRVYQMSPQGSLMTVAGTGNLGVRRQRRGGRGATESSGGTGFRHPGSLVYRR